MGIELPAELADVAATTGLAWPQADEDKLRTQAGAWRDAQRKLTALAADADKAAGGALGALTGPSADAASRKWAGFVHPDNGRLTTAASGAGAAADRLDHAADQVGQAKVEMVRQLVDAAKNRDAAQAAASAGHPTALLGLDTILRGTATNLSSLTHGLAGAVGPGSAGPASTLTNVVDPNPGTQTHEGQAGLLSTVTGLPAHAVSTVNSALGADGTSPTDQPPDHRGPASLLGERGPVHSLLGDRGPVGSLLGHGPLTESSAGSLGAGPLQISPGEPPAAPSPSLVDNPDAGTGPIRIPQPPGHYGGLLQPGGFADVPTPATGIPQPHGVPATPQFPAPSPQYQGGMVTGPPPFHSGTVASGFTDAAYSPPPQAAAVPPPIAPPAPAAQPGYVAPPPQYASPAPPPIGAPPPPTGYPPRQAPGVVAAPTPGPAGPAASAAGPAPRQAGHQVYRQQPYVPYAPQQPPRPVDAPPPVGTPRQERESIVALFLVHMFPLGHLPVAADKPARQLPPPPPEVDYAPGLRFPPHDHPHSDLLDATDAMERIAAGYSRLPTPPGEPPAALLEGHDPLGGLHERDWDRRFLAGMRGDVPEYAWPPGELYPEGGHEPGEPELLHAGTLLDRFGPIGGRIFAPDGTSFVQRSLPPAAATSGYRRYRVLRELPIWRAVSAPWFGQPGGGVRYRAVYSADELVTMGYLEDVTFEEGE